MHILVWKYQKVILKNNIMFRMVKKPYRHPTKIHSPLFIKASIGEQEPASGPFKRALELTKRSIRSQSRVRYTNFEGPRAGKNLKTGAEPQREPSLFKGSRSQRRLKESIKTGAVFFKRGWISYTEFKAVFRSAFLNKFYKILIRKLFYISQKKTT